MAEMNLCAHRYLSIVISDFVWIKLFAILLYLIDPHFSISDDTWLTI